jgi:hypothetical protein
MSSGADESIPASPAVTSTNDTARPAAGQAATAPAMPHSMSSGWGDDHRRLVPAARELDERHRSALSPPSTTSVWPVT